MKKALLFLLCSLAFGDSIQTLYQSQIDDMLTNKSMILNVFMTIFALFGATLLLIVFKFKKNKPKRKKHQINHMATLSPRSFARKEKNMDICRVLDIYFGILHEKASKNNNKIFFSFNAHQHRMIVLTDTQICSVFFTLCEFVCELIKNAHITIGLRVKKEEETKINFEFFIKCNKLLSDLKSENIEKTLFLKSNILAFKKLSNAAKIARGLNIKVFCQKWQRYSMLHFDYTFKKGDGVCPVLKRFNRQNTIILENSKWGFFHMASELKKLGLSVQPRHDINSSKKHLFSPIFTPAFVFINTKVLRGFTFAEIDELEKSRKNHGYKLILISDNASNDNFTWDIKDCYFLRHPFNDDALLSILDTPINRMLTKNIE